MRQKLRPDHAADEKQHGHSYAHHRHANHDPEVVDGPCHAVAVLAGDPFDDRIAPLLHSVAKRIAGQDRRDEDREDERAQQGEGNRPRHRPEKPALYSLQSEDRQEGRDHHRLRIKHGTLHFVRRGADPVVHGEPAVLLPAQVADDVLDHHHGTVHDHPEIERAQREQVGGDLAEVQTNGGEHQGERDRDGDDQSPADIAQEQKQNHRHEQHALGEILLYCARREVHQIAAIEEWNDLHARGQDALVQLLDLGVEGFQRRVGLGSFLQQHNAFHHVVVVDDSAVRAVDRFTVPAQPDLGALLNHGDILYLQRRPALRRENRLFDIVNAGHQAYRPNVDLLQSSLDETAARIDVVGRKLLLQLADAQPVGDQLVGIDPHLVFARGAAQARHVDHVGHGFELLLKHPVFERFQLHHVVFRVGALQRVEVDLSHRAPVGAHLRLQTCRQRRLRQPLQHLLAVPLVDRVVVEDQHDARQAEQRRGAQVFEVRQAVHGDLQGDRHLLFDLFRGAPGPLRDDVHVVVRHVRIGLDGQDAEG